MSINILDLLRGDGSIVVNKRLIKKIGLLESIAYSELVSKYFYWADRGGLVNEKIEHTEDAKWFFCTVENLADDTGITEAQQKRVIKKLEELGLIQKKKMGLPSKRYFTITQKIFELIEFKLPKNSENPHSNQFGENHRTSEVNFTELDERKKPTNNTKLNNTQNNNIKNKDLDLKNNLNRLNLPYQLKKHISNNLHLIKDDHGQGQFLISDIEKYFTKQQNRTIKEHVSESDYMHVSYDEFADTMISMMNKVKEVKTTYGLVKKWIDNKISLKREDYFDSLESEEAGTNNDPDEFINGFYEKLNRNGDHDKIASMKAW